MGWKKLENRDRDSEKRSLELEENDQSHVWNNGDSIIGLCSSDF